jgi:hypothetical protein
MKTETIFWAERKVGKRWQKQDGWDTKEKAERSAKFYRNVFKKAARVTEEKRGAKGKNVGEMFGKVLANVATLAEVVERHMRQQRMLHAGE